MEIAIGAARWVVGRALSPVTDGVLESWAASSELGTKIRDLKMELLYAQGMLDNSRGRDIRSPALGQLLLELRQLAYNADDVMDELEYFRIQDELDGTYETTDDADAGGLVQGLVLNLRHTARAVATKLKVSSCSCAAAASRGARDEEQEGAKQGCLSRACSCGRHKAPHSQGVMDADAGCMPKVIASSARAVGQILPCNSGIRADPDEEQEGAKQGCLSRACSCGGRKAIISSPLPNQAAQDADVGCTPKVIASSARAVGKLLPCYSLPSRAGKLVSNMPGNGRRFLCCTQHRKRAVLAPKLKFDRVEMSRKMTEIVEQLKPICAKVSTILNIELLGSNRTTTQGISLDRPKSTPQIIEPKIYGRENQIKDVVDGITHGKYSDNDLTVLPVVGVGGIGKTTFTQHIYDKVKSHFQVPIWICVSHNFNANRLAQEIVKQIPQGNNEKENARDEELIEKRLQSKQFLLVLDDMWTYHEDEWKKLLAPFKKGGTKGNMLIVTTRNLGVAKMVETTDCSIKLDRLGPKDCMDFFQACVFGDQQPWDSHAGLEEIGSEIVQRLKGSPLAVKTVGRLLRSQLSQEHWNRVLASKEWELQTNNDDIMPALKLSYIYLPFHLQQCFSHCALFPEDYEFTSKELIHLWIGLELLDTSDQNKRIEDIGESYLVDLVNHGFFKVGKWKNGLDYYVIHDLLHELAVNVSSYECLSIHSSNVRSVKIPTSVRHLSITVDSTTITDRKTYENFKGDLNILEKRLKAENLRTLMLFGEYHGCFVKTFRDLFREAQALRVIFLSEPSYNVEDMFHNFSKLIHLRYLRVKVKIFGKVNLPSSISRLYHLMVLDLQQHLCHFGSLRDMSNLVKMRHFLVDDDGYHSGIVEVGKLKSLQELRGFKVKQETNGFELKQLGQLLELRGSLGIYNLEKVRSIKEADEAKLAYKNHLHELILDWDINRSSKDPKLEQDVLESLKPDSHLQKLCIRGHGGGSCPTWLGVELSIKNLESLRLAGVAWDNIPLQGKLCMANEHGGECTGCVIGQGFQNLKRLELVDIPRLKKWRGNGTCHLLCHLEELVVRDCSELTELPFPYPTCGQAEQDEQEKNKTWFPKLWTIRISGCPNLLSLPPIPWTRTLRCVEIERVGLGFEGLSYSKNEESESRLSIVGKVALDSIFWNTLVFDNLTELQYLTIKSCPPVPLYHLKMLASLKTLTIEDSSSVLLPLEGESNLRYQFPVESLTIRSCSASGKELTQLLSHFPNLSKLDIVICPELTGLGVAKATSAAAATATEMDEAEISRQQQQQQKGGEEQIEAAEEEGLLLLPPQIQELWILACRELSLRCGSLDDDGTTAGGEGLQGLRSLRSLYIDDCPKLLSSNPSSSSYSPFPISLEELYLTGVEGMSTLALAPLTSLTKLGIYECRDLRGEGLWSLTSLTELLVRKAPNFIQQDPCGSTQLRVLATDDFAEPIFRLLSSSLTELTLCLNDEVERFTKEQEEALQILTSLQELTIESWKKLQSLPAALRRLPNLKRLEIILCKALRSLHKDVLPNSLEELEIWDCPALKSLPKDSLPSSLRELDVRYGNSEELKRQCRKLRGTIPIIEA